MMGAVIDGMREEFGEYVCVLADGMHVCLLRGEIAEVVSGGRINLGAGAAVPVALAIEGLIASAEAVFQAPSP